MNDDTPSFEPAPPAPVPTAGDEPTETDAPMSGIADAPTEPVPPVAAVNPTPRQVPHGHVAVPKWLLVSVAAIIGALLMFGIGYAVGDSTSGNDSRGANPPFGAANGRDRQNPFGNQGPGNRTMPEFPHSGGMGSQDGGAQQRPNPTASGGFLGIATQQTANGVEVTQVVSASAARDAGIEVGDVITEFDGNPVTTPAQLASAVSNYEPGDSVKVTYKRDGQTNTVTVTLGSRSGTN